MSLRELPDIKMVYPPAETHMRVRVFVADIGEKIFIGMKPKGTEDTVSFGEMRHLGVDGSRTDTDSFPKPWPVDSSEKVE